MSMNDGTAPMKLTLKEKTKLLVGRRIVKIEWRSFRTGGGFNGWTTDPIFHLDDGRLVTFSKVRFITDETERGDYGIIDVRIYNV